MTGVVVLLVALIMIALIEVVILTPIVTRINSVDLLVCVYLWLMVADYKCLLLNVLINQM